VGVTPREVHLHIEHLELDGLEVRDGATVAGALRDALAGHLALHGLPEAWASGGHVAAIDAGEVRFDGRAAHLGRQVAGALTGGTR
jgi:hypothetical protein